MNKVLIYILLGIVIIAALAETIRRRRKGSSCCGPRENDVKAAKAQHLTGNVQELRLNIGGMVCGNCAARVQNALNAIPGVSAKVSIDTKQAVVKYEEGVDPAAIRNAVRSCGYVPLN